MTQELDNIEPIEVDHTQPEESPTSTIFRILAKNLPQLTEIAEKKVSLIPEEEEKPIITPD